VNLGKSVRHWSDEDIGTSSRSRLIVITASAVATAIATAFVTAYCIELAGAAISESNLPRLAEVTVLYCLFYVLIYCNVMYQVANFGHFIRQSRPSRCGQSDLEQIYDRQDVKDLLILVPSYKEEEDVIRQTLISAALVEYPRRRVVLLIDDPPIAATAADAERLSCARSLPGELQALFQGPAAGLQHEYETYCDRRRRGKDEIGAELHRLSQLYTEAALWLEAQADRLGRDKNAAKSHTSRLFVRKILLDPAAAHRRRAAELAQLTPGSDRIAREYRRLASLFSVEFSSFERKLYANLSQAPNKAMNLNSHISLVGGNFREVVRADRRWLEPCSDRDATLTIPASEYIATVDADSLITSDYALRLVRIMEQSGNERIAVAQTPYTAVPGTPLAVERAAAASTDGQFFNHQGLAFFNASFWVGASALMRRAALEDIAREVEERGHRIKVYIENKVLIEDAAATIELINKGWRVHHDRGRLSYSATPPDFGALIIQRRRWANGGLLILPNLLRYAVRWPWSIGKLREVFVRLPTLASAAIGGVGLPILLFYRFDDSLVPLWMPIAAIPYYLLLGCDLVRAGYQWRDLPRVYALNLLLVPANLAGTVHSLRQAFTGRPVPFRRTPKITGRTPAPFLYLSAIYGLSLYALFCSVSDALLGRYRHMLFALFNGLAAVYGIAVFIGWKATREDLLAKARSTPAVLALARSVRRFMKPGAAGNSLAAADGTSPIVRKIGVD